MPAISFLIPTLFPPLVERMVQSIAADGKDDYEIVICCPEPVAGERVVWVQDTERVGCDPAIRKAFLASTGYTIIVLPDDHVLIPGTLEQALFSWGGANELMDLNAGWRPRIFGEQSVCYPLCHRKLVEEAWPHFFPYIQHFGDHSFALAAKRLGVTISQTTTPCLSYPWEDRKGCCESPTKTDPLAYRFGKARIFQDFPEYSRGYENRDDFND